MGDPVQPTRLGAQMRDVDSRAVSGLAAFSPRFVAGDERVDSIRADDLKTRRQAGAAATCSKALMVHGGQLACLYTTGLASSIHGPFSVTGDRA